MSILLGLPFLVHNNIVLDCAKCTALVKGTSIELLNLKSVPRNMPIWNNVSHKWKHLEIRNFHRDMLNELKWRCLEIKAVLDHSSKKGSLLGEQKFIAVNFIGTIRGRIESLEMQSKFNKLDEDLKHKYRQTFEPIPHVDELLDDILCRIKLKDMSKTIAKRSYGCPRKYRDA